MKQKIIIIAFGFFAVFLGIFLSLRETKTPKGLTTISPTPRQSENLPNTVVLPDAPTAVSFTAGSLLEAPKNLPEYSYVPIIFSFENAATLAQRFGFLEKPLKTKAEQSTTYQWLNNTNSFTLDSKDGAGWISFSQPTQTTFSSPLIQEATQGTVFLKSLLSQQENLCNLQLLRTSKGPFDGTVSTDSLTGYYYACTTPNQKPIFTETFNEAVASLIANQDGVIRSLSLNTLFAITGDIEKPILTPYEALQNIKRGGAIPISLSRGDGNVSFFDSPPQFDKVAISSYSFIYYPNTKTQTLEPYYVFEGTTNTAEKELLTVKYAFPALVKN